jgi:uncharacterized protein YfaS (alpha-2-macroglobulin family)
MLIRRDLAPQPTRRPFAALLRVSVFRVSFLIALILLAAGVLVFRAHAREQQLAATYSHGTLSFTVPFHAPHPGSGELVAEILDPEDHVLGKMERTVDVAEGDSAWQGNITPTKPIPFDEIIWHRLRYRFAYRGQASAAIEGIESISQILRRPLVHVLGQRQYIAGSRAAIRLIVSDSRGDSPLTGSVHIDLLSPGKSPRPLFSGNLNRRGTLEAAFRFPADLAGKFSMRYAVDTPVGSAESTEEVELADSVAILLTTEKPLYQPGQTLHIRALALDRAGMRAAADRDLDFEIEDSRGNKVFRKAAKTDSFGIASTEFPLADEVNLGTYHLRALMGSRESPTNTAEIALNVERYVLPKFKVAIEFPSINGKPRRDYRPGDHVSGTIRANYFFGKPVDHADVALKISGMDVELFQAASTTGKTGADGSYRFDLVLPAFFAGRPLTQGAARALVEATVKDSADHCETRGEPITVSQSSLLLTAIPEGGTLIPGIENEVFLLASYPDGTPATADLSIALPGNHQARVTTTAGGVAAVRFNPGDGVPSLKIDADDHKGNRVSSSVALETRGGADQILLHTGKAVFQAGDRIPLQVLSTRTRGTAYVDVVKNGQTILTRDLDLQNGRADLSLTVTPEMAGALDLDAYLFSRDAQPVADHRLVFVQPADELKIETRADAAEYKPGAEARVRFHVTNARGEGVSAALGLQVVDEAVFALAEKQPGFAKVFFYLEQEVMKPRYEIHSLSMDDVIEPASFHPVDPGAPPIVNSTGATASSRDLEARALFSATELAAPHRLDVEFGKTLPQDKQEAYRQRYQDALVARVQVLGKAFNREAVRLEKQHENQGQGGHALSEADLNGIFAKLGSSQPRDAWNTSLRMEQTRWRQGRDTYYRFVSAGPDKQFGTPDDLVVYMKVHTWAVPTPEVQPGPSAGTAEFTVEHDRGPRNGRADISGTVLDSSGAIIPGAEIKLHRLSSGETITAHASAVGDFSFAAIEPGAYRVSIASPGFSPFSQEISVQARDRGMLKATLAVASESQVVMVQAEAAPAPLPITNMAGVAMGMVRRAQGAVAPMAKFSASAVNVNADSLQLDGLMADKKSPALAQPGDTPHVRSYFPEALYINPEILTDGNGDATVSIPIADSITTWRMAMLASTQSGALGTGSSSLKVFQDFFVDLDLPVTLTQGDRVSIPVGIYNYSGSAGKVSLRLQPEDWYAMEQDDAEKSAEVESGRVGGSQFTLRAQKIGKFKLTLSAEMQSQGKAEVRRDIVVREIEVVPNGREQSLVFNGRLESAAKQELSFPVSAIPDATSILVRLYPGPLSQVIEGMDSILQLPGGCFEQTSSSTYPDILALDYMKRTKKLTPEVHAKAEAYILNGYQRLLTFEVPGGGFSWFGQAPANKILTAYGLMEFSDMSKVADVDPRLIQRTGEWLARQQQPGGSWKPDTYFINEGATNRYNSDVLRITAYLAWSLAATGYQGPAVSSAKSYIDAHMSSKADAYTLALIANFAADLNKGPQQDRDFLRRSMQALLDAKTEKDGQIFWTAEETSVYATGSSAQVETTGLAVQALLKWGQSSDTVRKALSFLSSRKQASGSWGTTQATIMALRALLMATELSASDVHGAVSVVVDGKTLETLKLTEENNDLLHQFVFQGISTRSPGEILPVDSGPVPQTGPSNTNSSSEQAAIRRRVPPVIPHIVELRFEGSGSLAYQIAGRYFTPWEQKPADEPLSIDIAYDRTQLAQSEIATAKATIRNNRNGTAKMVMVDLGIPPGFDLLSEDLQAFQDRSASAATGKLEKFSQTATQAILYFNALSPRQTLTITYRLRAKYPLHAHTFQSRVYEYYDPDISALARPIQLEVHPK